jgi:hypothetical protein
VPSDKPSHAPLAEAWQTLHAAGGADRAAAGDRRTLLLVPGASDVLKRVFIGRALRSDRQSEQELPKRLALPVFASDPLSSVAYATQEVLVVLSLGRAGLPLPDAPTSPPASCCC